MRYPYRTGFTQFGLLDGLRVGPGAIRISHLPAWENGFYTFYYLNFIKLSVKGARAIPFSVIIADTKDAGVTSNAGL